MEGVEQTTDSGAGGEGRKCLDRCGNVAGWQLLFNAPTSKREQFQKARRSSGVAGEGRRAGACV